MIDGAQPRSRSQSFHEGEGNTDTENNVLSRALISANRSAVSVPSDSRLHPKPVVTALQKGLMGVPVVKNLGELGGEWGSHKLSDKERDTFTKEAKDYFLGEEGKSLVKELVELFIPDGQSLPEKGDFRIGLDIDPKTFKAKLESMANKLGVSGKKYSDKLDILKEVIVEKVFSEIQNKNTEAFKSDLPIIDEHGRSQAELPLKRTFVRGEVLDRFRSELPDLLFGRHLLSKYQGPLCDIGLHRAAPQPITGSKDLSTPNSEESVRKQVAISSQLLAGASLRLENGRAPMAADPQLLLEAINDYKEGLKVRAQSSTPSVLVLAKLQDLLAKGFNPAFGGVGHFAKDSALATEGDYAKWKFTPLKEEQDLNSPMNQEALRALDDEINYYLSKAESHYSGNSLEKDMRGIQITATIGQIYNDILTDTSLPEEERLVLGELLQSNKLIPSKENLTSLADLHQGIRGHPLLMEYRIQPITDQIAPKVLAVFGKGADPLAEKVLSRALRRSPGTTLDDLAGLRGRMPTADKEFAKVVTGRYKATEFVMNMPDEADDRSKFNEAIADLGNLQGENLKTAIGGGTGIFHHGERPVAIQRQTVLPPHLEELCKSRDGEERVNILIAAINTEYNELQSERRKLSSKINDIENRLKIITPNDSQFGSLQVEHASLKERLSELLSELNKVEDLHWKFAVSHPEHVNLAPFSRGMQEKILQTLGKLEFGSIDVQDLQGRNHTLGILAGQRSVAGLIHDKGLRTLCSISGTTTDIALALVLTHGEGKVREWSEALLKVADGKLDPEDLPVAFHDFLSTVGLFMQGGQYHTVPEVLGGMLVVAEALERKQTAAGVSSINEGRSLNRLQRLLGLLAERPQVLLSAEGKSTEDSRIAVFKASPRVSQHDAGTGRGIRWGDQSAVRRQDPRSEKLIRDLEKAKTAADRKRVLADFQRADQSLWKDFIDLGKGEVSAVNEGIGFNEKLDDLRDGGHLQDSGLEKTEQAMGEAAALLGVAKYALGISKARKKKEVLSWSLQEAEQKLDAFQKVEGNRASIQKVRILRQEELTKLKDSLKTLETSASHSIPDSTPKSLLERLDALPKDAFNDKDNKNIQNIRSELRSFLASYSVKPRSNFGESFRKRLIAGLERQVLLVEKKSLIKERQSVDLRLSAIEDRFLTEYDRLQPQVEALRKEIGELKFKSQDNNAKLYVRYPAGVASSTFSLATPLTAGVAHTAVSATGGFLGLFGGISAFFSARRTHRARKEWQRLRQEIKDLDREIHTLKSAGRGISQEDADRLTLLESTRSQLSQQRKDERRQFFGEMFSAIAGTASFVSGALGLVALFVGAAPLLLVIASGFALAGIGCGLIGAGVLIGDAIAKRKRDEHRQNKMAEFQSAMARFEEFEKTHETEAPKSADRYDWNSYYAPLIRDLSKDHPRIRKMFEGGSRYNYFRKTGLDPVDIKDACRKYLEKRFINASAERTYHNLERELRALSMVMSGYENGKDGYPPPPHQGGNGQNPLSGNSSPSEKYFQDADDAVGGRDRFNRQFPTLATLRDLSSVGSNGLSEIHWCGGAKDGMKMLVSKLGSKLIQTESVMEKDYLKSAGSDAIHLQTAATGVHSNLYNSGKAGLLLLMKKHPRFWSEKAHLPTDLREKIKEFLQRPTHTGSQMTSLYEAMESQWPDKEHVRLEDPEYLLAAAFPDNIDTHFTYCPMASLNDADKLEYDLAGFLKEVNNPITQKSEKVYDLAKSVSLERGNSLNPQEPYYAVIGRYDSSGVADHSQLVDPLGEIQSGINRIEPSVIICNRGSMMSRPDHVTYERRPDGAWDVVEGSQRTYLGDLTMEGILKGMQDADSKKRAMWIRIARDLRENSVVVGYGQGNDEDFQTARSFFNDNKSLQRDNVPEQLSGVASSSISNDQVQENEEIVQIQQQAVSILSAEEIRDASNKSNPSGSLTQRVNQLTFQEFRNNDTVVSHDNYNDWTIANNKPKGLQDYVHIPVQADGYCLLTAYAAATNSTTTKLLQKIQDAITNKSELQQIWKNARENSFNKGSLDPENPNSKENINNFNKGGLGGRGLEVDQDLSKVFKEAGINFDIVSEQNGVFVRQNSDDMNVTAIKTVQPNVPVFFLKRGHFDLLMPKKLAVKYGFSTNGNKYIVNDAAPRTT